MTEEIKAEHRATFDARGIITCDCGWVSEKTDKPLMMLAKHQKETSKLPHGVYVLDAPKYIAVKCTCGWTETRAKVQTTLEERLAAHQRKVAKLPKGPKHRYR